MYRKAFVCKEGNNLLVTLNLRKITESKQSDFSINEHHKADFS